MSELIRIAIYAIIIEEIIIRTWIWKFILPILLYIVAFFRNFFSVRLVVVLTILSVYFGFFLLCQEFPEECMQGLHANLYYMIIIQKNIIIIQKNVIIAYKFVAETWFDIVVFITETLISSFHSFYLFLINNN